MKKKLELLHIVSRCLVVTASAGSRPSQREVNFKYPLPEANFKEARAQQVYFIEAGKSLDFCTKFSAHLVV